VLGIRIASLGTPLIPFKGSLAILGNSAPLFIGPAQTILRRRKLLSGRHAEVAQGLFVTGGYSSPLPIETPQINLGRSISFGGTFFEE